MLKSYVTKTKQNKKANLSLHKKIPKNDPKKGQEEQQKEVAEQERRKVESTNSPEIPDRRMTSDISGLPSWRRSRMTCKQLRTKQTKKQKPTKQTCFWVGAEEDVVIAQRHVT